MRLPLRRVGALLLALLGVSTTAFAQHQDRVSVRYLPGMPLPGNSSEWIDLRVERMRAPTRNDAQDVDRFFAAVEAILSRYGVAGDWQIVLPDAPSIEITVELDGRRVRLASAHLSLERDGRLVVTERGAEALGQRTRESVVSKQSESFRMHRQAFEELLALTLARARARLSPRADP